MCAKVTDYFENAIMPVIRDQYTEILTDMSIMGYMGTLTLAVLT